MNLISMYYFKDKLNVVKSELRSHGTKDNDDKNYPLLLSTPRID